MQQKLIKRMKINKTNHEILAKYTISYEQKVRE